VFYLNGVEVNRLNMPGGPITYTNLANVSVATAGYTGPYLIPTNFLVLGTNLLAVEVHQFTTNGIIRSEEHTSELQSRGHLVCRPPLSSTLFPYTTLFRSVFYLNGVEVNRLNMPGGPITYTNLANVSVATAGYTGPYLIPTNFLVLGTNLLAVEVHQFTTNGIIRSEERRVGKECKYRWSSY